MPDVINPTESNVRLIELIQFNQTQSHDWVPLSLVIEHNQNHKIFGAIKLIELFD